MYRWLSSSRPRLIQPLRSRPAARRLTVLFSRPSRLASWPWAMPRAATSSTRALASDADTPGTGEPDHGRVVGGEVHMNSCTAQLSGWYVLPVIVAPYNSDSGLAHSGHLSGLRRVRAPRSEERPVGNRKR